MKPCPPGVTPERWRQLCDIARQMDDRYKRAENVGAPRKDAD